MSATLLAETEALLQKHSPADFDNTIDAFPECIEYVRAVEDEDAWQHSYESLDGFYRAHEDRHPLIRVYADARREISTAETLTSPHESATQRLQRLVNTRGE
jgi:hypothetical protein